MRHNGSYIIFYDGECALCRKVKQEIEKWDRRQLLRWRSIYEPSILNEYPFLNGKKVQEKMHLLAEGSYLYTGFAAMKRIIQLLPGGKEISLLFKLPGTDTLGELIYKWVAKNRHKLLRRECDSGACTFRHVI